MARQLIRLSGTDRVDFLQNLVTNDVSKLASGPVYAALLTPQGKYLADFFLIDDQDAILIDVDTTLGPALTQRLTMYRLRADVAIAADARHLHRGFGTPPDDGWADPRHKALGWRAWRDDPAPPDATDWDALRVAHLIPETGVELTSDTYILEAGFEALNGVDFRKGCYVGQEITARMKHKTTLRKGLARVGILGLAEPGTEITVDGKPVGRLHTRTDTEAIAYLRFDRVKDEMQAGQATVSRLS